MRTTEESEAEMDTLIGQQQAVLRECLAFEHRLIKQMNFARFLCELAEKLSLLGKTEPEEFSHLAGSEEFRSLLSLVALRLSSLSDALEQYYIHQSEQDY